MNPPNDEEFYDDEDDDDVELTEEDMESIGWEWYYADFSEGLDDDDD